MTNRGLLPCSIDDIIEFLPHSENRNVSGKKKKVYQQLFRYPENQIEETQR